MKVTDVAGTALANTMRSKLRTFLTVVAIVIGAFTLTLTTGLGAGINKYVDNVVEGFGKPGELTVMKQQDMSSAGAASDAGGQRLPMVSFGSAPASSSSLAQSRRRSRKAGSRTRLE